MEVFKRHASAEMLFEEAQKQGLKPRWESACGLFSFRTYDRDVFVYYTKLHGNSQLGSQICVDKSLSRAFLAKEGFPNIPFCYSKKPPEINVFFDRYHPLVQKPLLGMKAQGVRLVRSRDEIRMNDLENMILEQYVDGMEYRCLFFHKPLLMQKKILDPTPAHPWRKHVTTLEPSEWMDELALMTESIAKLLHMSFMAVDFIVDAHGRPWVLELNSMPGLYGFQYPDTGKPVNVAEMLINAIKGEGTEESE